MNISLITEFFSNFGPYDFILIDGMTRRWYVIKSYELINEYGIVVMHDPNRTYYYDVFKLFDKQSPLNRL